MRLSVIIVNYNVRFFLEQCLYSVQKALHGITSEIWVVDNASTDGSRAYLEPRFPSVNFYWSPHNLGFAKANNYALNRARGEYILFLNPDTILPEDVFTLCLAYLDNNSKVGALGIRMLDGSGNFLKESKRAFPSPATAFYKLTGLANLFPKSPVFARYHLGHLDELKTQEVDVLSGAFMISRREILHRNAGFDESFFMYGEDIDLSYRIKKGGYTNIYFAQSTIIHFKGESTKKDSLRYVKMFYSAMAIFVRKHYGGARAGVFLFFIQLAIWFRALLAAVFHLFKPLSLTFADTTAIFCSFAFTNFVLDRFASAATGYPPLFSLKTPLFYTLVWFVFSRISKLYLAPFKKTKLLKNLMVSTAVSLVAASWLSDELSIGHIQVIIASSLLFALTVFYRWLNSRLGILQQGNIEQKDNTIVAGSIESYKKIQQSFGAQGKILTLKGRVTSNDNQENSVCTIEQLNDYVKTANINTIIYCENGFSFRRIIGSIDKLNKKLKIRINAAGSGSIIGSDSKDEMGESISI